MFEERDNESDWRDMEGVSKFQKVGHVTPHDPFWPIYDADE